MHARTHRKKRDIENDRQIHPQHTDKKERDREREAERERDRDREREKEMYERRCGKV